MTTYIALDGDGVGARLERYVLTNDGAGAAEFSKKVSEMFTLLAGAMARAGGDVLVSGGDSVLVEFHGRVDPVPNLVSVLSEAGWPVPVSAGVGDSPRDAWLALKYAKSMKPAVFRLRNDEFERLDAVVR